MSTQRQVYNVQIVRKFLNESTGRISANKRYNIVERQPDEVLSYEKNHTMIGYTMRCKTKLLRVVEIYRTQNYEAIMFLQQRLCADRLNKPEDRET